MRPDRCGGVRYAAARCHEWITHIGVAAAHEKGTSTPVNRLLLGHQAAEIVLFCLLAIALSAVIATLGQTIWTWISR